jgi:hypothetical protein
MFLLIRNVLPLTKTGFGKPVQLVKDALAEILTSDDGPDLADVAVTVIAAGRPIDPHSSSAYLELAHETRALDHLPRPDLLADWMKAIKKSRPTWEVVWAPQKKGKDRRMTIRFRVADSKEKVALNTPDKIRAHLESKGHRTIGGYISYYGLVDIAMADSHSVDTILSSSYFLIPSLSKEPLHVSSPRYISIDNPFELCITGLNDYDGLHEIIEKWLYHRYVRDDPAKTTRIFDTRMTSDRENYIFTMDSWESTLIVIKDADSFIAYFSNYPLLNPPKLVFELNSSGFGRKSTVSTINAGAGLVNDAISDLKRDLFDFRKEQTENNSLVQRQVAAIHVNMENQTNAVARIGNQLQQFGLSLLAGRDEKAIESRICVIDSSLAFESHCLQLCDDPAEKILLKANILALKNDRREQSVLLIKASDTTMRLIGPAPGTTVTVPPIHAADPPPSYNTPATTPALTQPDVPVQLPPARQSNANRFPASVAADLPSTPTRPVRIPVKHVNTPYTPSQSSPTMSSTPTNSTPLVFDFSSIPTTPFPPGKYPMSAKRSQPTDAPLPQSPTKKIRSSERTAPARSPSKPTPASLPIADSEMNDVFNESGVMVRNTTLTESPHLITACADQGEHRYASGLRPLTIDPSQVTPKLLGLPTVTDQLGRVHIAESPHSSYPQCHISSRKMIPKFLTWIIITLIVLCTANSAAAMRTPAGSLSLFALNTNSFVHPTKIDATNRTISHRNPDIIVITETKTNSACATKMATNRYQFFEERGSPVTGFHTYKWGVILGIKNGITVAQRLPITHPALSGRLIAVDVVIPLDSGLGFTHRIIAAYAPWNVTDTSETAAFWSEAAKLCNSTPHSWTLLGDLNATVAQAERKSGGSDARTHYLEFLRVSKGFDLWSNYPERTRLSDWTCKPRLSTDGGNIIDRIVTSSNSYLDTEIFVADSHHDYVPMTDHRPIMGRLILKPPDRNSARCTPERPPPVLNNPRIKFPDYKDKHLFQLYRDETDARIQRDGLHESAVTDDASFITLYRQVTNIINQTAVQVFGRIKRKKHDVQKTVTNQTIQQLQGRSRAIGGALRLINDPSYIPSRSAVTAHTLFLLDYSRNPSTHPSLRSFLIAKRKSVNKDLYRERSNEIYTRAKKYDSFRISQALAGGSTKRLVQPAEFVPLPMSINSTDGSSKLITSPDDVKAETRRY